MTGFYHNQWNGSFDGTEEELALLLSRAADIVDNAISISGYTVKTVPQLWHDRVYKAVCAQADFIEAQGGAESLTESPYSSVTLGKFSYTKAASNASENTSGTSAEVLCPLAHSYLAPTGLLYRGVTVV